MAAAPRFKVYDRDDVYQACTKRPEEAGVVVGLLGAGATIRDGHSDVVWAEGKESVPAGESLDVLAKTIWARLAERTEQGRV